MLAGLMRAVLVLARPSPGWRGWRGEQRHPVLRDRGHLAAVPMPRWLRPGRLRCVEVTEHFEMHTEVYEAEVDTGTGERSHPSVTEREVMVEEQITWTRQDAAERRANILKARRRMLGTLVALTVIAFLIAMMQVAAIWVVIPPALMLGGFVLLLREASRSDAEQARRRTHAEETRRRQAEPAEPLVRAPGGSCDR